MNAVAMMRSIVVILGLAGLAACAHSAAPGEAFRDCTLCPEMVMMPTDAFAMGAPEAVANATGGGPMFAVSRTEVTFAQWDACVAARGCDGYRPSDLGWGRGNRPVINVTWNNAQAYVRWLSRRTRHAYRLLSSAEWEIAARARSTTIFSWGDEPPVCDEGARNGANFYDCPDDRTRPVASFPPNAFGLFDVHGNVEEWVEDCYEECSYRVTRDGSWFSDPQYIQSATSFRGHPDHSSQFVGFRVARTS